ncbi:hypothetical protein TRVA0_029S01728 [Trichomonascus vanleenenianus]|uniref:Lee1p n=1 Tax=Trichomonascus vanleenenianus TaxID=2268995 RepID=UPI003ECAFEF3
MKMETMTAGNHHSSKLSSGLKQQLRGSNTAPNSATNPKNLSHVPCKFFRQGACQAGNACPFSHSTDSGELAPCKYFQKGNCKFGAKCANAHILPDGRRVNHRSGYYNGGSSSNSGGNVNGEKRHHGNQQAQQPQQGQASSQAANTASSATSSVAVPATASSPAAAGSQTVQNAPAPTMSSLQPQAIPGSLPATTQLNDFAASGIGSIHQNRALSSLQEQASLRSQQQLQQQQPQPQRAFSRSLSTSVWGGGATGPTERSGSFTNRTGSLFASSMGLNSDDLDESAIEDEDYGEDFVPSSLTDLLTPQERQRRGSRPSSVSASHYDIWNNSPRRAVLGTSHGGSNVHTPTNGGSVMGHHVHSPLAANGSRHRRTESFSQATDIPITQNITKTLQPVGTPERSSMSLLSRLNMTSPPHIRERKDSDEEAATTAEEDTQFYMEEDDVTKDQNDILDKMKQMGV